MHRTHSLTILPCFTLLLTLTACTHTDPSPDDTKPTAPSSGSSEEKNDSGLSLTEAIGKLKVARESRTEYEREKFKLWVDDDHDGCDTRKEVLLAEAVKKPRQGEDCKLTGGTWRSYYDDKTIADAGKLDIDHVVPLAEAWDSGASKWTAERRKAYANDLDAERSLVAVSLGSNRSKGDQDPAEWLPPPKDALCTYATDWVTTKLRWNLNADRAETKALHQVAKGCKEATVTFTPAP
ncbi:HNH endonuclease family protein [Streptomyces botrytidirepellens]|uniref:HNH endonuclease n=1 Tax=Streptomyces botrytidirepellens TaxID=2486417 RepID=A0A3M8VY36_9ACTN|nr:HNH endonuclease family protein [Streptomyces botrytidirepellens]RNG22818.1 HNH endonuclease [Streptomyces botrytidirepellens]